MKRISIVTVVCLGTALPSAAQMRINGSQVIEGTINSCDDTANSEAYACNLASALSGYVVGSQYCFRAATTNPGAATLNLNGLGAKTIRKYAGARMTDLEANDIVAGQRVCVIYDGMYMQVISRTGGTLMRSFGGTFDGSGAALTGGANTAVYTVVPFACTISSFDILVNAGTVTFKLWRKPTGTAIPTNGDSINTSGVSISSGTAVHSTTLTDFTSTLVAANDIIAVNLSAASSANWARLQVNCQ